MRNLFVSIFCFCITVVALAVTGFDENNVYGKPKRESDVWGRGEQGAARIHGISCFCMGCQRERNKEREKELARVREDTESAFKYNSQQQRERCETYNDFKKELKRGVDGEPDVRGYRDFNSCGRIIFSFELSYGGR